MVIFYTNLEKQFSNFIKFFINKCLFFYYDKLKNRQNSNLINFSSKGHFHFKNKTKKPKQNWLRFFNIIKTNKIILLRPDWRSSLNIFLRLHCVLPMSPQTRDIRNGQHLHRNKYNRSFLGLKLLLKL